MVGLKKKELKLREQLSVSWCYTTKKKKKSQKMRLVQRSWESSILVCPETLWHKTMDIKSFSPRT